jgi:hypothetical protein
MHAHILALALDMDRKSSVNLDDREQLTDLGRSGRNRKCNGADSG